MTVLYKARPIFVGQNANLDFLAKDLNVDKSEFTIELTKEEKRMNADYNGTSVSLTSKDALALMQIKTAFEMGETRTVLKFENGTKMELTPVTFTGFATWFIAKRNEFFQE